MGGRLRAQVRAKAARHHHCAHRECSLERAKRRQLLGCTRADESKIYQSHNNGGGAGSLRDSDGNRGADVCSMATPGELASEEDCTPANGECHCNLESRLVAEFREGNPEDANGAGESVCRHRRTSTALPGRRSITLPTRSYAHAVSGAFAN